MKNIVIFIIGILLIGFGAYVVIQNQHARNLPDTNPPIGGDRDANGCLVAAGYSFDEQIGACARDFELTSDIAHAARIAVEKVGRGYALTIASFNSYEDGTYDITVERGEERTQETVHVVPKTATFGCAEGKRITARFYPGLDTSVDLNLSDGRSLAVPHAISASGARYATADESFVFWNKGDTAFITENSTTTFADCVVEQ